MDWKQTRRDAVTFLGLLVAMLSNSATAQGPIADPFPSASETPPLGPSSRTARVAEGSNSSTSWLFASRGSGDSTIFKVDEVDQSLDTIGDVGRNGISDIAFTSDGRLFGCRQKARGTDLMSINPRTGAGEIVGDMNALGVNALVSSPDGVMYAASNTGNFFRIDIGTGLADLVGPLGSNLASVGDLAFDDQGTLYATLAVDPDFRFPVPTVLAIVDPATGAATQIGPTGFDDVYGLAFHPGLLLEVGGLTIRGPTLFGVAGRPETSLELITIDRQTGAGQSLGVITDSDQMSGLAANFRLPPTRGDLEMAAFLDSGMANVCSNSVEAWTFCQHKVPPEHSAGLDIDDTFAWDANLFANQDAGEPVYAVAPGAVVSFYGEVPPGGDSVNTVLIEHCLTGGSCDCQTTPTNCWWSRYLYMSDIQVSEGQQVNPCTVLGSIADVGVDGEERLHFGIYEGENARLQGQGLLTSIDTVLVPTPPIFRDAFEYGDTSCWSRTVPAP